jgi:hypothetical protein
VFKLIFPSVFPSLFALPAAVFNIIDDYSLRRKEEEKKEGKTID